MSIGTLLDTLINGRKVGTDRFGNKYYAERRTPEGRRQRRWVIYKDTLEPSRVPAEWHAWLHHTTEAPIESPDRPWYKDHVPNLTGTPAAYVPPGDERRGGRRDRATGDYEPWRPA